MKFLLADPDKRNPYLLARLVEEEHEVLLLTHVKHKEYNLQSVVYHPSEGLDWNPDIALFQPGLGQAAHQFYSRGIKVFGGGLIHDTFHDDPEYIGILSSRVRVPICRLDNGGPKIKAAGLYSKTGFIGPALAFSQENGLHSQGGTPEAIFLQRLPSDSQLVHDTFVKLEKVLTCVDYCGWAFLEIQLDPETGAPHIHALSVDVPEGFYAAFLKGLTQPLGKLLNSVANRKKGFNFDFTEDLVGAVKVSIPPYPLVRFPWLEGPYQLVAEQLVLKGAKGHKILQPEKYANWLDVRRTEDGLETTGPEVGWVTSQSDNWDDLISRLETLAQDTIENAQYKQNLNNKLKKHLTYFEETLERPKSGRR